MEENGISSTYITKPSKIDMLTKTKLRITVTEGKKREIRRIFQAVNNRVLKLKRISIGDISLDNLNIEKGKYLVVEKEFLNTKII